MHPDQFSILRRHFKAIKPHRISIAREVVRGLADAHPKFARWAKRRWTTVDDLNALIRAGVYRVHDFPQFERLFLRWGKRLASLGVRHDGLIEFRASLLAQLAAADPELWKAETEAAWAAFLDSAIGVLLRPILTHKPSPQVAVMVGGQPSSSRRAQPSAAPANAASPAIAAHELVIRDATSEDLSGIFAIYDHEVLHGTSTFDTVPKTADQRLEWLAAHLSPKYPALVAVDPRRPSEILGWGTLSPWSPRPAYDRTAENSIYVRESARGMGVGRELMRHLVLAARANRVAVLIARIAAGNPPSIALHKRCGFQHVGKLRRVGQKFGQLLDVHIMDLHLDGESSGQIAKS